MMLFGSEPKELTKALALYGAAAPAGGTAGVFLGGVITEYLSWPWVFYLNVPIAVAVLAVTPSVMPAGGQRRGSVDVVGAVTVTAGLALAVYGIVRAPEAGWFAGETLLAVGAAIVLLAAFVALQTRRRDPLVRLGIFRAPNLAAANVAQLLLGAAWIPMWFFLNLYLQQVLGYTAFPSGAALLPMTIVIMIGMIALAPRLIGRIGPKALTVTGLAVLAAGMAWLAFVRPDGTFWVDVLPASVVAALGMSMAFIPTLGTAVSAARPEEGGLASGIVNTSYQVGSALGLAAITALATVQGADALGDPATLTDGYSAAFVGAAVVALVGAVLAAATLRGARTRTGDEARPSTSPRDPHPNARRAGRRKTPARRAPPPPGVLMARLRPLDPDQAPSTARDLLGGIVARHGDAGPMVRTMAHSPAVLQGYLELSRAMKRSAIARPLSEKISLAVQECSAARSASTPTRPRRAPRASPTPRSRWPARAPPPTPARPRSSPTRCACSPSRARSPTPTSRSCATTAGATG